MPERQQKPTPSVMVVPMAVYQVNPISSGAKRNSEAMVATATPKATVASS